MLLPTKYPLKNCFKEFFSAILLSLMLLSCSEKLETLPETDPVLPPIDTKADRLQDLKELRVLAIGNSYTWDATSYINTIADSTGMDKKRFCIYIMTSSGASLAHWSEVYTSHSTDSIYRIAGDMTMHVTKGSLDEIFKQPWNVIVFQQFSGEAYNYNTYNSYLKTLTTAARQHCANDSVLLAWHMIHSYGQRYSGSSERSRGYWRKIVQAAWNVMSNDDIDLIIPSGTAIQNARLSSLNTNHELTRDGSHLAYGVGRYVSACTWVESLLSPMFGIPVLDKKCTHTITFEEYQDANNIYDDSCVPVNDKNWRLCQQCAHYACLSPYMITDL